ncbi:storkhead-box protein 1 [Ictalurus furcatus]|uniref:storkhead-box protein 1 n=1 Tax=Ictalurus furcatus TaxID=66913 RepID=UPI00234FDE33|nr:storkhead-box protein 1 [Ictalurus furcatus]XP_053477011.1 storkhead-box protein 1 [Ictalurus furcatus]
MSQQQQQQQRVVQLSAAALAVVLRKDDDDDSASASSGHDVFMDFKSENLRSFWNKRLVKAVSEVYFQGWMENSVLLVQGSGSNLEVLREAWMRRALRSPKGFTIKAVGDLSPVQMSPISQSQFIPLSEVLCSVISDMNVAHVMVNQEALINHMMKAHPGMAIPTQDILYNALGALIKERKIYHTGEGYFIVTPQTYFISNNMVKEKNWWTSDNDNLSPPPITYLMSNESYVDASTEVPIMAHCKSCSCFTPQLTAPPSVQEQSISISECTGKSLKWPREHKPTVQHQSTSTAADYQASEISKSTTTSRKDKEKPGRKFGLNLFRRNMGKKENKLKKEYATFSGQFPPEEWPVRDEDDLNNLPRDLEHAIIKRINPELTVDNLVRHTVLMKKMEEKAERVTKALTTDKGMSTEILLPKQRHHSTKAGGKRSASKANRSKRRVPSAKEKQRTKSKDIPCDDDLQGDDLIPSCLRPELVLDESAHHEDCTALDAKFVYKKRIEDPFQSIPGSHTAVNQKELRRREAKTSSRRERAGHRSKSWDPHHVKAVTEEVQKACILFDRSCEQLHERGLNLDSTLDAKTIKELPGDFSSFYPENSTLRIEDKVKQKGGEFGDGRVKQMKQVLQAIDLKDISDQKLGTDLASLSYKATELPVSWPKPTGRCRLSLHLVNSKEESDHCPDLLSSHQQTGSLASNQHLENSERIHRNTNHADSEVHTDVEHHIYQNVEDDDDGCSSLYLNEEHVNELVHPGTSRCREPVCFDGNWDSSFIEESILTLHQDTKRAPLRQHEYRWPQTEHKSGLSHLPADGSPGGKPQHVDEKLNKPSPGHSDPTETLDISIFDYSQISERGSDTETVLKSADEDNDQARRWICHSLDYNQNQSVDANNLQPASLSHCDRTGACTGEISENQSNTADSGIDSPRTRMSLTSTNSVILKGLKRRNFLQNLETLHSKTSSIHPQSSLLQLTPVMNV